MWQPEPDPWREFEDLIQRTHDSGQTVDYFEKHLRALAERHRWDNRLPVSDRRRFRAFAAHIYRSHNRIAYACHRHEQLVAGQYSLWVYRAATDWDDCHADHARLDGIAVPVEHPFWTRFFPPNGPGCGCAVYGAGTVAGVRRVGGNPDKTLPEDWEAVPVHREWVGTHWPDLRGIFAAALRDLAE